MELSAELRRVAERAVRHLDPGEELAGIVPAEPSEGARVYLCAFRDEQGETSWLLIDEAGEPVESRAAIREAVSIVALCELAEESAGGGDLDELSAQLVALRLTEHPPGLEEAEEALSALQSTIGASPRLATPAQLDAVGAATRLLEEALGDGVGSPFAAAMRNASATVESVSADVEANYKRELTE